MAEALGESAVSMIVHDFDVVYFSRIPVEADPVLVVDADRILSPSISSERFEPKARETE